MNISLTKREEVAGANTIDLFPVLVSSKKINSRGEFVMHTKKVRFVVMVVLIAMLAAFPLSAGASHSWGNYHWARTSNPFTLKLGDNVTSVWDSYLAEASSDWSQSSVLNTT